MIKDKTRAHDRRNTLGCGIFYVSLLVNINRTLPLLSLPPSLSSFHQGSSRVPSPGKEIDLKKNRHDSRQSTNRYLLY